MRTNCRDTFCLGRLYTVCFLLLRGVQYLYFVPDINNSFPFFIFMFLYKTSVNVTELLSVPFLERTMFSFILRFGSHTTQLVL